MLNLLNLKLLKTHIQHLNENSKYIKEQYEKIEKILKKENKNTINELINFSGKEEKYFDTILDIYRMAEHQKNNINNILEYIDKNIQ